MKPEEIKKLDAYFKRMFNPQMIVKARPRKDDSAEVYLGEEFLGVVYIDDEDGGVIEEDALADTSGWIDVGLEDAGGTALQIERE
ncbi:DUF3126 family protein, partial [Rhizobium ruizarguesonis]